MATKGAIVRLYNRSTQMIPIQLKPPGGDFFLHEQVAYLRPRQTVKVPKSHLNLDQIHNLQARRALQILFDSDTAEAMRAVENGDV